MNIRAPSPQARGATGIPVNRQSLASRWAFLSSFFMFAGQFAMAFAFPSHAQAQATGYWTYRTPGLIRFCSQFFLCLALAMTLANHSFAQSPQGRLSLVSNTPVMTSDVTNATTVYYVPYQGNALFTSSGTLVSPSTFPSQLTLSLESSVQTSGNIYDIFAVLQSGTWYLCTGPAWSSSTSRGTGAGTTQLSQLDGAWVNTNAISNCYYSTSSISVGAKVGIYLGSIYMTGNGETSVQFKPTSAAGGTNNVIGIWNAYERVPIDSLSRDSTSSWTYAAGSTWQAADASNSNRVSWLDGLQQTFVRGKYSTITSYSTGPGNPFIGVDLDSTTSGPNVFSGMAIATVSGWNFRLEVEESFPPQLGLHYLQAVEHSGENTATFYGAPSGVQYQSLILHGEY